MKRHAVPGETAIKTTFRRGKGHLTAREARRARPAHAKDGGPRPSRTGGGAAPTADGHARRPESPVRCAACARFSTASRHTKCLPTDGEHREPASPVSASSDRHGWLVRARLSGWRLGAPGLPGEPVISACQALHQHQTHARAPDTLTRDWDT